MEQIENTAESLVSSEEKTLWRGKRNKKINSFYLTFSLILTFIIAILSLVIQPTTYNVSLSTSTSGITTFLFILIIGSVISILIYSNIQSEKYIITNKKTIIQTGIFTKKLSYAYHSNIQHLDLSQGQLSSLFNVGTIYIDSGKKITSTTRRNSLRGLNMSPMKPKTIYDILNDVENPQKIYTLIKQFSHKENTPTSFNNNDENKNAENDNNENNANKNKTTNDPQTYNINNIKDPRIISKSKK
ncbi:MAG: PH domain-containing protein [Candidatus Woesearchaeota archaeon]|jgi:membrane protein YdbS with pleckstrin-like domain